MNYIANSFFHFTDQMDVIIRILENGFSPRYCFEDYRFLLDENRMKGLPTEIGIPMVCFCDIPLTHVKEHVKYYGNFAIGMNSDWGHKVLNPVFYLQEHSVPAKMLIALQYELLKRNFKETIDMLSSSNINKNQKDELIKNLYEYQQYKFEAFQDFIGYVKNYKGVFHKNTEIEKIFYNEREWRWIPLVSDDDKSKNIFLRLTPDQKDEKDKFNITISKTYHLNFEITDINYLIVDTKKAKVELAEKITLLKKLQNDQKNLLELITKIISLEEIDKDF